VEVVSQHLFWSAECLFICFTFIYLFPTALLICMENTFWNISRGGDFVELFKKSFALYIESGMSGMRKKMEADIDKLVSGNQSGHPLAVTEEFNEMFGKTIVEHYLCTFHSSCFYLSSKSTDISNHFLHLNTAAHRDRDPEDQLKLEQNLCMSL
jgi:hypothetical protein